MGRKIYNRLKDNNNHELIRRYKQVYHTTSLAKEYLSNILNYDDSFYEYEQYSYNEYLKPEYNRIICNKLKNKIWFRFLFSHNYKYEFSQDSNIASELFDLKIALKTDSLDHYFLNSRDLNENQKEYLKNNQKTILYDLSFSFDIITICQYDVVGIDQSIDDDDEEKEEEKNQDNYDGVELRIEDFIDILEYYNTEIYNMDLLHKTIFDDLIFHLYLVMDVNAFSYNDSYKKMDNYILKYFKIGKEKFELEDFIDIFDKAVSEYF